MKLVWLRLPVVGRLALVKAAEPESVRLVRLAAPAPVMLQLADCRATVALALPTVAVPE